MQIKVITPVPAKYALAHMHTSTHAQTKEVEVLYLLRRLGGQKVSFIGPAGTASDIAAHRHFGYDLYGVWYPIA